MTAIIEAQMLAKSFRFKFDKAVQVARKVRRWISSRNTSNSNRFFSNAENNFDISSLPAEILECIFGFVSAKDVVRISQVCRRFHSICLESRQYLPRLCVDNLTIAYGEWRDVLKYRGKDANLLEYDTMPAVGKNNHHQRKTQHLSGIIENCLFKKVVVNVEMLNVDLRLTLKLARVEAEHLVINLSHASLLVPALGRYFPTICEDLRRNKRITRVDFVLNSLIFHFPSILEDFRVAKLAASKQCFIFFV